MKKRNLVGIWMFCASLMFVSCSEDNTNPNNRETPTDEEMEAVVAIYVDKVVIPTYADMLAKVTALKTSVDLFVSNGNGTQANLTAACTAWRAARIPWERSEAFLFGPVDFEGLDPSLDTWPLDKNGIDQILMNQDFKSVSADGEAAEVLRGFHTLEYLIFENGTPKENAAEIGSAQKTYMALVAKLLQEDTKELYDAWKESYEGGKPYGQRFKEGNAGTISSIQNAVAQIVDGCMTIAGEVKFNKIGIPYQEYKKAKNQTEKDLAVLQVESWYSWNSLDDYHDNIVSIENSYMGGIEGNRDTEKSLSTLVRKYDEAIDTDVIQAIKDAKDAIRGIPAPFRNNLDKKTEIENAQDVLADLEDALLKIKIALVLN